MPGSVASGTLYIICCSIVVFQHSPRARCSKTRQEADSTIMRKLKRLFVKGYSWRSPILPWRNFTKSCQDWSAVGSCWKTVVLQWNKSTTVSVVITYHVIYMTWGTVRIAYQQSRNISKPIQWWGTRWRSWLRHCATSRKVAGSIPDGVIGIFNWYNPSGRTMALGLSQPLTEMSTRNISWGVKAAVA